jgi:predicted ester cyclase
VPRGDPVQDNKAIVHRFDDLVRDGDPDDLVELCTPDMVNHALAGARPPGLDGTREFLVECRRDPRRTKWMCGMVHRDQAVVAENDLVVQFAVVEAVWPGGTFRGVETASGPYKTNAAFMYRLVDGRIAERWAVRDDLGMMRQLGAIQ